MATTRLMSADDLLQLAGEGERFELIRGELQHVSPSGMRSSVIGLRIASRLARFVDTNKLGLVTAADGGYVIERDPATVLAPDIGFVRASRLLAGSLPEGYFPGPPDLAVEVLSPTDRPGDVARKVALYHAAGVAQVWRVDPRARTNTVSQPEGEPRVLTETDVLDG
nr:Uma2 family endonuclease [Chloroflexota bacterium]